jgi:exodeoxyribonuclease V alpha subunit
MGLNSSKLAEIRARVIAAQALSTAIQTAPPAPLLTASPNFTLAALNKQVGVSSAPPIPLTSEPLTATDRHGKVIEYNTKQQQFVELASAGSEDCILIGAAGTGKTTCMKGVVSSLILSGTAGIYSDTTHKHLQADTPGIVVCAYTRRAVNNIRKNMPEDMRGNCITIHKLLEYEPVFYEVIDPATGREKKKMEFRPGRNELNPLSSSIHTVIFEESSMIGTDLYRQVQNALCHPHQEIFLGDIQQLPPVFGPAILGFKLQSLRTIELTEVYRQALESPIIRLAHSILSGKRIGPGELQEMIVPGQLVIKPWSKTISPDHALAVLGKLDDPKNLGLFPKLLDNGGYDPEEDMILIPQNVGLGTNELNKYIAQYIATKHGREVYEVVAGFDKAYFSVGEKIMYERNDGIITKIEPNPLYGGSKLVRPASKTLTYWGMEISSQRNKENEGVENAEFEDIDFLLAQSAIADDDRVHAASHRVTIKLADSENEIVLDKAGQINNTILGYALTVHKAQGSEWRRVFLVFHQSHNRMLQRELLYTAVTRAREELVVICEKDSFERGIESQRIKGNSLAEKAEYFKGKYVSGVDDKNLGNSHEL